MFSRHFRVFFRIHRHVFQTFRAHIRSFLFNGFHKSCSLRVGTLLPLVILRSAECSQRDDQEVRRLSRKRTMSKVRYETCLEGRAQNYLNAIKVRWEQLHKTPGLFSYQLHKTPQCRRIPGHWGFYTELNADRALKRRRPQTIENLNPTFKPTMFNFNKVNAQEVIMTIHDAFGSPEVQMIINKSPITNPGALASVNHLHFHLLHMPQDLYIDQAPLDELVGGHVYRLSRRAPTEAICIVFNKEDNAEQVEEKVDQLYKLAMWMCQNNMPHNLFITQDRRKGKSGDVQVFVFARSEYCVNKDLVDFNVGFCELAGYIPLPDPDKMENLTELQVLYRIRTVTGEAPKAVYEEITNIVEGCEQSLWDLPLTI
ncbi:hypothetical protein M5D96_006735 [Drosophila gunungcola]|uniref:GDP-D-glucose phosphorylase 1 n=1 Tax=Drosophila gunungcola TaxID=103775 RepID=A0A9Q0BQE9_9MUSC|nr:hypothetical protein M5D96_006735 [Drosophila gunungcola]